jgi:hypothetical protein
VKVHRHIAPELLRVVREDLRSRLECFLLRREGTCEGSMPWLMDQTV